MGGLIHLIDLSPSFPYDYKYSTRWSVILLLVRIRKKAPQAGPKAPINEQIRVSELRLLAEDGENLGLMSGSEALKRARAIGTDLILIAEDANPPVGKIMDYGKWQYLEKKKNKVAKQKQKEHATDTKSIQIKVGTGDGDLLVKSKRSSQFLKEGHRVKVELYLKGRAKFLGKDFHEERLSRVLRLITEPYKIMDGPKQSPKGVMLILERDKGAVRVDATPNQNTKPGEEVTKEEKSAEQELAT